MVKFIKLLNDCVNNGVVLVKGSTKPDMMGRGTGDNLYQI